MSHEELAARAISVEGRGRNFGVNELELAIFLRSKLVELTREKAIGSYSVDIALDTDPVAVEVQRAYPRKDRPGQISTRQERLEYIFNAGWRVLIIYCPPGGRWVAGKMVKRVERFDCSAVGKKVLAFRDFVRGNPAVFGQYGVIDGYGKSCSVPRLDLHGWSRVPGF
jgi:hypothetical protein